MKNCIQIVGILIGITIISCESKKDLPDPLEAGWQNEKVCEVIEDNENVRVLRCTFAPGVGHEKHYHKAHFAYSVSGSTFKLEDADGIREAEFPTGANYYSQGVEWHTALNIGDTTAIVLIVEPK